MTDDQRKSCIDQDYLEKLAHKVFMEAEEDRLRMTFGLEPLTFGKKQADGPNRPTVEIKKPPRG